MLEADMHAWLNPRVQAVVIAQCVSHLAQSPIIVDVLRSGKCLFKITIYKQNGVGQN